MINYNVYTVKSAVSLVFHTRFKYKHVSITHAINMFQSIFLSKHISTPFCVWDMFETCLRHVLNGVSVIITGKKRIFFHYQTGIWIWKPVNFRRNWKILSQVSRFLLHVTWQLLNKDTEYGIIIVLTFLNDWYSCK